MQDLTLKIVGLQDLTLRGGGIYGIIFKIMGRESMEIKQILEEKLRSIEGILAVSSKFGTENKLEALNLIVDNSRNYSQWRREISQLVSELMGDDLDPAVINIAVWNSRDLAQSWGRPKVDKVSFETSADHAQVRVCLSWRGDHFWGEASGPNTAAFVRMLISQATLRALEGFLKESFSLSLLGCQELTIQDRALIVVCVSVCSSYGEQTLTGSAFVKNNYLEAVVKATLDSLNRIWGRISI